MSRPVYTYVIASTWPGRVKIGKSVDPPRRRRQLQTASPERLYLVTIVPGDQEAELHERFGVERIRGEWFEPSQALIEWVEGTKRFFPPPKPSRNGPPSMKL